MKVIVMWILIGYFAVAAAFYSYLTATAQPEFTENKSSVIIDMAEWKRQKQKGCRKVA